MYMNSLFCQKADSLWFPGKNEMSPFYIETIPAQLALAELVTTQV